MLKNGVKKLVRKNTFCFCVKKIGVKKWCEKIGVKKLV